MHKILQQFKKKNCPTFFKQKPIILICHCNTNTLNTILFSCLRINTAFTMDAKASSKEIIEKHVLLKFVLFINLYICFLVPEKDLLQ